MMRMETSRCDTCGGGPAVRLFEDGKATDKFGCAAHRVTSKTRFPGGMGAITIQQNVAGATRALCSRCTFVTAWIEGGARVMDLLAAHYAESHVRCQ